MLVSHGHGFVFLKVRKAAGTSIEMALEPLCRPAGATVSERTPAIVTAQGVVGRRLSPRPRNRDARCLDWRNHMPAAEIRAALGDARWSRYMKVTSVRDPFDLAVSRYHWELARRALPEAADFAETRRQFAAMVSDPTYDGGHELVHVEGAFVADRVIRFERLGTDFAAISAELAPDRPPLPRTKTTTDRRRRPVADYYDDASVAAIRRAAAWVFDLFDYPDRPTPGRPRPLPSLEVTP